MILSVFFVFYSSLFSIAGVSSILNATLSGFTDVGGQTYLPNGFFLFITQIDANLGKEKELSLNV